ncbi:DUF4097 family beta strand repeat-containing protein [Lewinella sp. IMCC34191]|uniref:DUF4097 family beta strand repeat-containing protein n=1 Tax=Lewinella sp. IMCC34191 TaxID=2259172 RepID=UPI000E23548B|nr:DUF4097 family beta strand repeat-containing protein [Lewinella sp. IMCC34191]
MLRFIICSLLLAAGHLHAQSKTQTIATEGADHLFISSQFGNVELFPSASGEITVTHLVLINDTERPDLGEISVDRSGNRLRLEEVGPNQQTLSEECEDRVTVNNGVRIRGCNSRIRLRIGVPPGMSIEVETEYGDVEVADIAGLTRVHSTYGTLEIAPSELEPGSKLDLYSNYGDVDLTLPADATAKLELITEYGSLMTDFDIRIDKAASEQRQFYERVVGTIGQGGGAQVKCRSPYDNVYLRRAK